MSMGYLVRESGPTRARPKWGPRLTWVAPGLLSTFAAQSATGENPIVWRGMMVMKAVQQVSPPAVAKRTRTRIRSKLNVNVNVAVSCCLMSTGRQEPAQATKGTTSTFS